MEAARIAVDTLLPPVCARWWCPRGRARRPWPTPWPRPTPPDGWSCWSGSTSASAGFTALGLALSAGAPAAVLTTSGTAVGNLLPAVMEANHAAVPLVVISADRPEELRGTGANQTTVQLDLFGEHVRFAVDVPAGSDPQRAVETGPQRRHRSLRGRPARAGAAEPCLPRPAGPGRGRRAARGAGRGMYRAARNPLALDFPAASNGAAGAAHRGAGRARRRSGRRGLRPRARPAAAGRAVLQRPLRPQHGGALPAADRALRRGLGTADRTCGPLRPADALPAGERAAGAGRCPLGPVPARSGGLVRTRPPHRTAAGNPGGPGGVRRPRGCRLARCLAAGRSRRAARRGPDPGRVPRSDRPVGGRRGLETPAGSWYWAPRTGSATSTSPGRRPRNRRPPCSPTAVWPGSTAPRPPPPGSRWAAARKPPCSWGT